MKSLKFIFVLVAVLILIIPQVVAQQQTYLVSSIAEFEEAQTNASSGDSIVWESGTYSNIFMDIDKDGLTITAEESGAVIMTGGSKVEMPASNITFSGIQYIGGDIGNDHVFRIDGSHNLITQINIQDYKSYKYLIIDERSQYVTVSYSNFENRINFADQNILSILVDNDTPGYNKVQYCSFKNFAGIGADQGVEPIRIGVSSQKEYISRSIIEYCYFTECDGDGEIISNKATQNVMRYNTFENNTKAELVLRHGHQGIVYGNFFLNNMGGVRVREGRGHFIFNNYFEGNDRRSIFLQNEASDPLDSIHIYFNTLVNNGQLELGGSGNNDPTNVTFANNILSNTSGNLLNDPTGAETWINNFSNGTLGIDQLDGITPLDPLLEKNTFDFSQLSSTSPAIDAAEAGFPTLPTFEGIEMDNEILLDLMKQSRPASITMKDVGASEFSATDMVPVQPHVTAANTGPLYLGDITYVTISATQSGSGQVTISPSSDFYIQGTIVTITAVPDEGERFLGWGQDLSGDEVSQTITLDKSIRITGVFTVPAPDPDPIVEPLKIEEEDLIFLYPNPSASVLNFSLNIERPEKILIEIYTISGQQTGIRLEEHLLTGKHTLSQNIDQLSAGLYLVSIEHYDQENKLLSTDRLKILKR